MTTKGLGMATVTVTDPDGKVKVFNFGTFAQADRFGSDYFFGLSYADGLETLIEVSE